jgi:hypothetical protein
MSKLGRNDLCFCGSGKKYKNCHLPLEEAAKAEGRRLKQAQDTLLPKLVEAAKGLPEATATAFGRFWNQTYSTDQLGTIDEHEARGSERFLTWFLFDYPLENDQTLIERFASGEGTLEFDDYEKQLLPAWKGVRLRPYIVESIKKGQGFAARDLLDQRAVAVEDHAVSRALSVGEVIVAHLLPIGEQSYIGGAAAQLTSDTADKIREFAELHLEAFRREHPDAAWADLLRARSEVLNHFVMQLPEEEADPNLLEQIITQTKVSLALAGESLGLRRTATTDDKTDDPSDAAATEDQTDDSSPATAPETTESTAPERVV